MALLQLFQEKLIFLPTALEQDFEYSFETPFEEIFIDVKDGARLNAIHFKSEKPQGIIVYFHGNAGDLSRWGAISEYLAQKNWDVVVMDYRTYGKSTGALSETAFYSDAQLFYEYCKQYFSEKKIIVYGRSLGCAMATKVASQNRPSRLILETPFYNLHDIARRRFPILPIKSMLNYGFENNTNILEVECPITIFQGTEDDIVPYDSAKKLFDLVEKEQNSFIKIDGGEHNNLIDFEGYLTKIDELLGVENIGG